MSVWLSHPLPDLGREYATNMDGHTTDSTVRSFQHFALKQVERFGARMTYLRN